MTDTRSFTAAARWRDERVMCHRPWSISFGGHTFEFFTNGHFLLAASVHSSALPASPGAGRDAVIAILADARSHEGVSMPRRELLGASGPVVERSRCPRCQLEVPPRRTIARVGGSFLFDRRYLAEAADFLGDPLEIGILVKDPNEHVSLVARSDDGIAVVMGVRGLDEEPVTTLDLPESAIWRLEP